MHYHAMEESAGSAGAVSSPQGLEALPPEDDSSPSPGLDRLTPESSGDSSNEDLGHKEQGLVMDTLFSSSSSHNGSSDDDEVYELDERGSREVGGGHGRLRSGFSYTAEEERAVVNKFDRRLVLFVAFLYMLSFLDRSSLSHFPLPSC